MNIREEQILKGVHQNFITLGETQALLKNLDKKFNEQIQFILLQSITGKITDAEIRTKCAQAYATKELIEYVRTNYTSIIWKREEQSNTGS